MRYIALLRGINVSGKNKIPMADLRDLAIELELKDATTYIQSGNLVFSSSSSQAKVEPMLEGAIQARFGCDVPVIVRRDTHWSLYAQGSPYPDAEQERPNLLMLALCKKPIHPAAVERLLERAQLGERVTGFKDGLWIDFAGGSARSKITPALLDRTCGAPVTTRNFRTVLAIQALF